MSYDWSGMAVKAPEVTVFEHMNRFFQVRGGSLEQAEMRPERGDPRFVKVAEREGWTLIGFSSFCVVPQWQLPV